MKFKITRLDSPFTSITLDGNLLRWQIDGNTPISPTQKFFVSVVDWDGNAIFGGGYNGAVREVDLGRETLDWKSKVLDKPKSNYLVKINLDDMATGKTLARAELEVKLGVSWWKRNGFTTVLFGAVAVVLVLIAWILTSGLRTVSVSNKNKDTSSSALASSNELREAQLQLDERSATAASLSNKLDLLQGTINELKALTNAPATVYVTNEVIKLITNTPATPATNVSVSVAPTNVPNPPPGGIGIAVGTINGGLVLHVGGNGQVNVNGSRVKRPAIDGMPEKPAYETNILESAISPQKGLELNVYRVVPAGDGVRFIKPAGWIVRTEVYASTNQYASINSFKRMINTRTHDDPDWIELELATKRQTPIEAESMWIWSPDRAVTVRFILTPNL